MRSRLPRAQSRRFIPIFSQTFGGRLKASQLPTFYSLARSQSNAAAQGSAISRLRDARVLPQHPHNVGLIRQGPQVPKLPQTRARGVHASHRDGKSTTQSKSQGNKVVNGRHVRQSGATKLNGNRSKPDSWMRLLESFLPVALRLATSKKISASEDVEDLVNILLMARTYVGNDFDLLHYMLVIHRRDQAVLHLMDKMLSSVSIPTPDANKPPSNVTWPSELFELGSLDCFDLNKAPVLGARQSSLEQRFQSPVGGKVQENVMRHIWLSLGNIVITATNRDAPETRQIMSLVHRVLAKAHHHGLVPDTIYEYQSTPHSSIVNRAPVLHLLSSRILTALSDAAWRSQQDEMIARAAADLGSIEEIYKNPPGGRFRLRVRDLGPEVWLEFILWCCVEGRYASTGAKIVEALRRETATPWFAVNWTSNDLGRSVPLVDWDKVHMRTGGTVGRIEGYSGDEPLANIPKQTISTEVVLALVEGVINGMDVGSAVKPNAFKRISSNVKNLVSFLEPHSLSAEYFDYLTVRVLQSDSMDYDKNALSLITWSNEMAQLRELEYATPPLVPKPTLKYNDIVSQSLTRAGTMLQSLMALISGGYVSYSIDHFSAIQHHVDRSKVQSILAFVQTPRLDEHGFFDSRPSIAHEEYANSHGQPSSYVTAAFLQHMTENRELELAQWLVYSEDIDGPVIPSQEYAQISVALAVTRLAAETADADLLQKAAEAGKSWKFKPAVKLLRAIADAHIRLMDFHRAGLAFEQLRFAIAGGYSPKNLANLAATILRMEAESASVPNGEFDFRIRQAQSLLRRILRGDFNATVGDLYRSQLVLFRQQVGHLLRILQNLPQSGLSHIANAFIPSYPTGNAANLAPQTFNTLLSGIVDAYGANAGRRIWQIFCKDPRVRSQNSHDHEGLELFLDDVVAKKTENLEENYHEPAAEATDRGHGQQLYFVDDAEEPNGMDFSTSGESLALDSDIKEALASDVTFTADFESFDWIHRQPQFETVTTPGRVEVDQSDRTSPDTLSHVGDDQPKSDPCVIPDIQSMRIITKSALVEQDTSSVKNTKDILFWAASYMRQIGRARAEIELETTLSRDAVRHSRTTPTQHAFNDVDLQSLAEKVPVNIRKHFVDVKEEPDSVDRQLLWQNLLRRNKHRTV